MATRENICIHQGETFIFSFDSLGQDLTGFFAKIQFRENVKSQADSILSEITNITLDVDGIISIRIESPETYNFLWSSGVYDVLLVSNSGGVSKPYYGSVSISGSVTR